MRQKQCSLCDRLAKTPTAPTEWLLRDSHEGVGVAKCGCGNLWLHFWVEIFDDITHFWAPLSPEEVEGVRKQAGAGDDAELLRLTHRIVRGRTVLMDGTAQIGWIPGQHAILSGPPW